MALWIDGYVLSKRYAGDIVERWEMFDVSLSLVQDDNLFVPAMDSRQDIRGWKCAAFLTTLKGESGN